MPFAVSQCFSSRCKKVNQTGEAIFPAALHGKFIRDRSAPAQGRAGKQHRLTRAQHDQGSAQRVEDNMFHVLSSIRY
jgi:hypothetical protein